LQEKGNGRRKKRARENENLERKGGREEFLLR